MSINKLIASLFLLATLHLNHSEGKEKNQPISGGEGGGSLESEVIPITNVSGILGQNALLPCDTTPPSSDHPLLLVIWFKDEATDDPIYSYDVRGNDVEIGRHWKDVINLGARARFEEKSRPISTLVIDDLRKIDKGSYRCRVDFRHAPTKNYRINLDIIIPPGRPLIHNERGILLEENKFGPYNEGSELLLTCSVSGGYPRPKIYWIRDGASVPESSISSVVHGIDESKSDVVSSTYMVGIVQRRDVDSEFTCLASNTNLTHASKVTRILRMNLLPLHVHISSLRTSLSAGSLYDIHCKTFGSRPSSLITWWLGSKRILDESTKTSKDGNVTESTLRFQPQIKDQGKLLRCRSENPVMPASQIEDTWHLDINYLPRVSLDLGSTLSSEHIKEGDDVYFECFVDSKPRFHKLTWKFNGIDIHQDLREGIIMGNQSLVLQSLDRNASGTYHCMATNIEGNSLSNAVELNIKYKPVCAEDQKMVYGIAHGEIASINCSVISEPSENLRFHWTFNSSSEMNFLPESRYTQMGTTSQLVYSLNTGRDYGTILCWAENELGDQEEPCVFHLIPAVPPVEPLNCFIDNLTSTGLSVACRAGFDGGVPQTFVLGIRSYNTGEIIRNLSSISPRFTLDELSPDTKYELKLYSFNAKGNSKVVKLLETTKKDESIRDVKFSFSAESTLGEQGELKPLSTLPEKQGSFQENWLHPVLTIVGGIVSALVLVTVVIILAIKFRCAMRRSASNSSSHEHTWKTDSVDSNKSLTIIDNKEVDSLFQTSPVTLEDTDEATGTASTSISESLHPSIISSSLQLPPPPPRPPLRNIPVAALSTLPKNFPHHHHHDRFPITLLQSFPSAASENQSFAVSALALDLGSYPEIEGRVRAGLSSMDAIEGEILIPPPAECLYTLPRKKTIGLPSSAESSSSKTRRSVRFDDIKKKTPGRRRKSNMESAV